jgi:hypothetical protein
MRAEGRVELGPYARGSKSERESQPFLVTATGERLLLRRYDGPSLGDKVLQKLVGRTVIAEGLRRGPVFIARRLTATGPPRAHGRER